MNNVGILLIMSRVSQLSIFPLFSTTHTHSVRNTFMAGNSPDSVADIHGFGDGFFFFGPKLDLKEVMEAKWYPKETEVGFAIYLPGCMEDMGVS